MIKHEQVRRLLVRAERARKHLMQPHFTRIGLTFGQGHARILDVLMTRDHITQKELSDLCHMDVTTMSRSLDRLEESGYLVREKDPGCRRSYLICLTKEGFAEAQKHSALLWKRYVKIWNSVILNLMKRKRKEKPPCRNRKHSVGAVLSAAPF